MPANIEVRDRTDYFTAVPDALTDAFINNEINQAALVLWVILKTYARKKRTAHPSIPLLATNLHCSERHIQRLCASLVEAGFLKITYRFNAATQSHRSNLYELISKP